METDSFEIQVLDKVRREMAFLSDVDDSLVRELITEAVFSEPNASSYSISQLMGVGTRTFLRIRKPLGILTPLIEDSTIEEIMINGAENIFVDKQGMIERLEYGFASTEELEDLIQNIASGVHREVNELHPIVDARLDEYLKILS